MYITGYKALFQVVADRTEDVQNVWSVNVVPRLLGDARSWNLQVGVLLIEGREKRRVKAAKISTSVTWGFVVS